LRVFLMVSRVGGILSSSLVYSESSFLSVLMLVVHISYHSIYGLLFFYFSYFRLYQSFLGI
jgi:hypothetical protein